MVKKKETSKKNTPGKHFIDERGYVRRYLKNGKDELIHRDIAREHIYEKQRYKFSQPFGKYIVHHIDMNKRNNHPSNLLIMFQDDHEKIHGYHGIEEEILPEYMTDSNTLFFLRIIAYGLLACLGLFVLAKGSDTTELTLVGIGASLFYYLYRMIRTFIQYEEDVKPEGFTWLLKLIFGKGISIRRRYNGCACFVKVYTLKILSMIIVFSLMSMFFLTAFI
tara:strand:+ start:86 stop:748 length:663 start_codon:yes stop_codon:yes gene_type:complete